MNFSVPSADPQTSGQPVTPAEMDVDCVGTSKVQQKLLGGVCEDHIDSNILDLKEADDSSYMHDDNIQTPNLNEGLLPCEPTEGPSADPSAMDFAYSAAEVPSSDLTEWAQAPSTPGLMMEAVPSLSLLKKTSLDNVVDVEGVIGKSDLGSVSTDSTKLIPEDTLSNRPYKTDYHVEGSPNALNCASLNDKSCETDILPVQNMDIESSCGIPQNMLTNHNGNGLFPSDGLISSDMIQSVSSPTSVLSEHKPICAAPECPGRHLVEQDEHSLKYRQDRTEILENGAPCSGVSNISIINQTHNDAEAVEPQVEPLDVTTVSPSCTVEASCLHASYDKPLDGVATVPALHVSAINGQPSSDGAPAIKSLESFQHDNNTSPELLTNVGPVDAVEDSCPSCAALPSNAELQFGSTSKHGVEIPCACIHVLQACNSSVNQSNALALEDNVNAPELSSAEVGSCAIEAQETLALHVDIASSELHGWFSTRHLSLLMNYLEFRN